MFEPRIGRLSWSVLAPSPPDDVTPDLVRQAVAGSPGAVAVELSAAFLDRRPGSYMGDWRRLDQELESEGIAVYFAPGGAAFWEIKVSTCPHPAAANAAESRPESPVEAVTPTNLTLERDQGCYRPYRLERAPVRRRRSNPASRNLPAWV